jgi:phospholipid transport system substrate-binding protein
MARIALALVLFSAPAAAAEIEPSPMAELHRDNDAIARILRSHAPPGSPEERAARDQLTAIANRLLDYDELARLSLGPHWRELSPDQRREFTATLRELIERHYVEQLRTNLDYEVVYRGQKWRGDRATVDTTMKVHTRGKSTNVDVAYALRWSDGRWRVYDVVTDDVSMLVNYRVEFDRIIRRDGYPRLIEKMKRRIEEIAPVAAVPGDPSPRRLPFSLAGARAALGGRPPRSRPGTDGARDAE